MTFNIVGVDISKWDDAYETPQKINFEKMKAAGAAFVYFKVSQSNWADRVFLSSWQDAKTAGLLRGGYHYLDWTCSAVTQAIAFTKFLKPDPGELPPVCDFEHKPVPDGVDPRAELLAFLTHVEDGMGRVPAIYTSPGYWREFGSSSLSWSRFSLWVANWTSSPKPTIPLPWKSYIFWQYTCQGDGIAYGAESKSIDLNRFNGTMEELNTLAGIVNPPTPTLTIEQRLLRLEKLHDL